jgi:hypothetical protein
MMDLQELVSRARFIFSDAPTRFETYKLVDGKKTSKDIAKDIGRAKTNIANDLRKMADLEIILPKKDARGDVIKRKGFIIYEKNPLIKHVPYLYFKGISKNQLRLKKDEIKKNIHRTCPEGISTPSENEILDISKDGENQVYEFKAAGTDIRKLTKEIASFLHTKRGGIIFYGVENDGTIAGTDKRLQDIDQSLYNSIKNTIKPSTAITVLLKDVMGTKIILIKMPPWDRKTVYYYEGRVYIRKGTNCFEASPEEIKKLHSNKDLGF